MSIESESRKLASLAVFRELCDVKANIFDLIADFIGEIIGSKCLHSFDLASMAQYLKEDYGFTLPQAVLKTSIKRMSWIVRVQGAYVVKNRIRSDVLEINKRVAQEEERNKVVLNELFEFVSRKKMETLDEKSKSRIAHAFCAFLVNERNGEEYSDYIAAFCVASAETQDYKNIREAVVIYEGLRFDVNPAERGVWSGKMTVYLDMDVLFCGAGYNGELYRRLFSDLHGLIKDANYSKKLISLAYFEDTKDDICNFFKVARNIVGGADSLEPNSEAMSCIVNGCGGVSDVITKEVQFFNELDKLGIRCVSRESVASSKNYQFNVDSQGLFCELQKKGTIDEDFARNKIALLNSVAIARGAGEHQYIENCKSILVTNNKKTLAIARCIGVGGAISLAETTDFLTERLWFKLRKGFGGASSAPEPLMFSAAIKAKIILSGRTSKCISDAFSKAKIEYANGSITNANLLEIRARCILDYVGADYVCSENVDAILSLDGDPDKILRELALERQASKELKVELQLLREREIIREEQERRFAECEIERLKMQIDKVDGFKGKVRLVGRGLVILLWVLFSLFAWINMEFLTGSVVKGLSILVFPLIAFLFCFGFACLTGRKFEITDVVKFIDFLSDRIFLRVYGGKMKIYGEKIESLRADIVKNSRQETRKD